MGIKNIFLFIINNLVNDYRSYCGKLAERYIVATRQSASSNDVLSSQSRNPSSIS